jgi:hypothetical protein
MNERQAVWTRGVAGFGMNCVEPSGLVTRELVTITDENVSVAIARHTARTCMDLLIIPTLISMAHVTWTVRPTAYVSCYG